MGRYAQFSSTWPSKSLSIPSPHSSEFGVGDGGIGGIGGGLGLEAHSAFQVLGPTTPSADRLFASGTVLQPFQYYHQILRQPAPGLNPRSASKFCSLVTSGPEESFFMV